MEDLVTPSDGPRASDLASIAHEIARAIEAEGTTRAIFGQPVKVDDHTVIPVATLEIGFGGAGGSGRGVAFEKVRDAAAGPVSKLVLLSKRVPGGAGFGVGGGFSLRLRPAGFLSESEGRVLFTAIEVPAAKTWRR